jgi:diguanylate cyclase (GGDEF)-like protein
VDGARGSGHPGEVLVACCCDWRSPSGVLLKRSRETSTKEAVKAPRHIAISLSLYLLVFVIGYLDYLTGPEIGFSLFYFIPIMLTSWFHYDRKISLVLIPAMSALAWLLADLYAGHHYSAAWIPYWNMFTRLGMFLVIGTALSRLRAAHASEKMLSRTDPMTGVYNTRYFTELVTKELSRATRFSEAFSFAYLDVDNFKGVNDTLGHDQGDQLLKKLTGAIKDNIRDIDIIVRLGGDEFGVFFPKTDSTQSLAVMNKIFAVLRRNVSARWEVTLSAGVLTYLAPPKSVDEMIRSADALMYKAKRKGKDHAEYHVVTESGSGW